MHRQREKRLARLRFLLCDYSTQHAGTTHCDHHRARRLTGDTAGFQRDLVVTVLESFFHYIHLFSPNMTRPA